MEGLDLTGQAGQPGAPVGAGQVNMRYLENSVVDDRTLREIYLPAGAAERVAAGGITFLKNNAILPLNDKKVRSIAVIGAYAGKFVTGGGSGNVTPFSTVTGLAGIRARGRC